YLFLAFLLLLLSLPCSPFFPYTTLFRSIPIAILGELVSIGTLLAFVIVCAGVWMLRRTDPGLPRPFKTPLVPFVPIMGALISLLDRKSTRLNSSHVSISYAVFCLKKKNY